MSVPAVRGERGQLVDHRGRTIIDVRDPRAATRRIGYHSPEMPIVQEWNAEQAFRFGVLANVVAYRCVQILAGNASSPPLVAGRNPRKPTDINERAPIARLLGPPPGGPAPKLSARKLLRWTIAQQIVTGRRAWEIEVGADGRTPVAFWPLATAHLQAIPANGGNDWFRLFKYGNASQPVKFNPDQVFYGWEPGGTDFRQAESVLQSARYDLSLVTLSDRHSLSFLRNNAVPATVVTTTAFTSDDQRRAFERQWGAEFGGVDNVGRTAFNYADDGDGPVGDTIDVKTLGVSAKDARLIEQRKAAMAEIAIALGVPWSKLDASGRTFDNAEVEDRTMWEEHLLPMMSDLVDDINMQIAPRLGTDVVWFDLSGVRALQRKFTPITQTVGAPSMVQARLMWINEARADYGLPPVPDGDRFMTAAEIQELAGAGSSTEAVRAALEQIEQRMTAVETERREQPAIEPPTPTVETREVDPEAIEARRARIWRSADAVVRGLESRWQRAWVKMFARQSEATLSRLTGKRGRQAQRAAGEPIDPAIIFDQEFWIAATGELVEGLYEDTAAAGLARLSLAYGVDFDLAAPFVREFIESRVNQLAGPVTQTTYEAIQQALIDGVDAGEGIEDMADRVRAVFAQASQHRAETIARTEVVSAYNGAASLGASQLPADVVAAQEWIATRDGRTRERHASADGQIVAIGEPFVVGGREMAYPGDPAGGASNTVNCRCTVAFLTPEEMADAGRARPGLDTRHAAALLSGITADFDELAGIRQFRAMEAVA